MPGSATEEEVEVEHIGVQPKDPISSVAPASDRLALVQDEEFHDRIVQELSSIGGRACLGDLARRFRGLRPPDLKPVLMQMVHERVLRILEPDVSADSSARERELFTVYELNL